MSSPQKNRTSIAPGVVFVGAIAGGAWLLSRLPLLVELRISPLIVGIVVGLFYANTLRSRHPESWNPGIIFSAKRLLRVAIILYGFRLTMQDVVAVGVPGVTVSVVMLTSTFLFGTFVGIKLLRMDRDTALLTASGASVCGAAAVLATDSVLKAEPAKSAAALGTVVLFGTIAMFVYPAMYAAGIIPLDRPEFGVYVGGSVHEVAQVVAVGSAVEGSADTAIIVKMTRVMLIAPMLIVLGLAISRRSGKAAAGGGDEAAGGGRVRLVIPWFAVGFIGVVSFNSLKLIPHEVVERLIQIDTFLLTMTMTALGMETTLAKLRSVGMKPFYLALAMFGWLIVAGFFVTRLAVRLG